MKKMKVKSLLVGASLFALGMIFGCCLGGVIAVGSPSEIVSEPPLTLAPTLTPATKTPTPSWSQEEEAVTVAPVFKTVKDLERERGELTDLQKVQYDQDILGEPIAFKGKVSDVTKEGSIVLSCGEGFFTLVTLAGLPQETLLNINKDDFLQGMGTVLEVSDFLILSIELQVTSLNN